MNKNIKLVMLALASSLQMANVEAFFPWEPTEQEKNEAKIVSYCNQKNVFQTFEEAIEKNSFPQVATYLACDHINPKLEHCKLNRIDLLNKAIRKDNILIVSALLDARDSRLRSLFDVNSADNHGRTPLMEAIESNGNKNCINLLIRYGADLSLVVDNGTILHSASKRGYYDSNIMNKIKTIWNKNEFFSARDSEGNDIFSLACEAFQRGRISSNFFGEILNYSEYYQFTQSSFITQGVAQDRKLVNILLEIKELLEEDSWFLKLRKNFKINDPKVRRELIGKIDAFVGRWQEQSGFKACYM